MSRRVIEEEELERIRQRAVAPFHSDSRTRQEVDVAFEQAKQWARLHKAEAIEEIYRVIDQAGEEAKGWPLSDPSRQSARRDDRLEDERTRLHDALASVAGMTLDQRVHVLVCALAELKVDLRELREKVGGKGVGQPSSIREGVVKRSGHNDPPAGERPPTPTPGRA